MRVLSDVPAGSPAPPKPIISPLAQAFSDSKFILVLIGIGMDVLVKAIPALVPYSNELTLIIFLAFGVLVLHQGAEDLIVTYQENKPVVTTTVTTTPTPPDSTMTVETKAEPKPTPDTPVAGTNAPIGPEG